MLHCFFGGHPHFIQAVDDLFGDLLRALSAFGPGLPAVFLPCDTGCFEGFRNTVHLVGAIGDGGFQLVHVRITAVDNGKPAGHGVCAKDRCRRRALFRFGQSAQLLAELLDHLIHGVHSAMAVCNGDAVLFHSGGNLLGRFHQAGQAAADGCTSLAALDAGIRHHTDGQGAILRAVTQCASDRGSVFERFAHHADVRIGVGGRGGQDIGEMPGFGRAHTESGQRIGHDVRSGSQILAGSRCQIHDAFDAGQHVFCFPTGHGHVLEGSPRL